MKLLEMLTVLGFLLFGAVYGKNECQATAGTTWLTCPHSQYALDGAVCLDGTPYMYFYRPAVNPVHQNNWVIYFQGGGWCYNAQECLQRANTTLGSSKDWAASYPGKGIPGEGIGLFQADAKKNPDFYAWNWIYLAYCDGASFSGDVSDPVPVGNGHVYYRGRRILQTTISLLVREKSLNNAKNVVVSGCSAGGLSVYLHVDQVAQQVPRTARVIGASDSGYFIDDPDVNGIYHIRKQYQGVFNMQNASAGVNARCIAAYGPQDRWRCFMAQYALAHVQSAMIILNPSYDTWQLGAIIAPQSSSWGWWGKCLSDQKRCTAAQMKAAQNFYSSLVSSWHNYTAAKPIGVWAPSCWTHCLRGNTWNDLLVDGVSQQQALGSFLRGTARSYIDPPYPDGCKYKKAGEDM